jgi:hypothetical protein
VLISSTTIGSAVSSVVVSNVFSSTYDNYRVVVGGGTATTTGDLGFTFNGSATGYGSKLFYGSFSDNGVVALGISNGSSFTYAGGYSTSALSMNLDVFGPNLAKPTRVGSNFGAQPLGGAGSYNGTHSVATAYTGFTVTANSGTMTGGTISVYGYK